MKWARRNIAGTFVALAVISLSACPRPPPPVVTPPPVTEAPAPRIPRGCEADQSGVWVHAQNAAYRYVARDDGGTLELALVRAAPTPDAGNWDFLAESELTTFDALMLGQLASLEAADADAGEPPLSFPDDAGVLIVVSRTPAGFLGSTFSTAFNQANTACRVAWPTEVFACGDAGLVLRSAAKSSIDENCQPPAKPAPAVMVEHRLVRYAPKVR